CANDWKIPEMANRYSLPGYIPAAPSLIEVRTMVHHETGCVRILVVGHREGADRRPARNTQRVPGQVALQTISITPLQLWARDRFLFELIENRPLPRILRRNFNRAGAANPSNRRRIAEENGPRILEADVLRLRACVREDQHLRFD